MNNASAAASTLFLGHNGDWWDFWLLISVLVVAPLAAAAIGGATAGSIISHKREAEAAALALARNQSETDGKVADAKMAGIGAGLVASDAQAKLKNAEARITEGEAKIADANARVAEANLRTEQLRAQLMPRRVDLAAFKKALAGQPSAPVEILFDVDSSDAMPFAVELFGSLRNNNWPAPKSKMEMKTASTAQQLSMANQRFILRPLQFHAKRHANLSVPCPGRLWRDVSGFPAPGA